MSKREIKVSPRGIARWPWLQTPDTQFDAQGTYKVDLIVDPADSDVRQMLVGIKETVESKFGEEGHVPYGKIEDENDPHTGLYFVRFKSRYAPRLFDAFGKKWPEDIIIGSESVIKVAYAENLWTVKATGSGMTLWINAVQVIDLVEYKGSAEAYGFEVETEAEEVPDGAGSEDEDNLPF